MRRFLVVAASAFLAVALAGWLVFARTGHGGGSGSHRGESGAHGGKGGFRGVVTVLPETTTAVTPSKTSVAFGDPVSFTAKVSATAGTTTPTGTVQFTTG